MPLDAKLKALDRIYAAHAAFTKNVRFACRRFCSACCTSNVTLTSLEGAYILRQLEQAPRKALAQRIRQAYRTTLMRFKPKVTTNRLAQMCQKGLEPPDEDPPPRAPACPLLHNDECTIYPLRPFGCRCFFSTVNCRQTGYAKLSPVVLTANTVCQQTIEHLDVHGFSGNLTDILYDLVDRQGHALCAQSAPLAQGRGLLANSPLTILMVPPEHREPIRPLLQSLRQITL